MAAYGTSAGVPPSTDSRCIFGGQPCQRHARATSQHPVSAACQQPHATHNPMLLSTPCSAAGQQRPKHCPAPHPPQQRTANSLSTPLKRNTCLVQPCTYDATHALGCPGQCSHIACCAAHHAKKHAHAVASQACQETLVQASLLLHYDRGRWRGVLAVSGVVLACRVACFGAALVAGVLAKALDALARLLDARQLGQECRTAGVQARA